MKIWRSYKEQVLFLSLALSIVGLINVFNSSYVMAMNTEHNPYFYLLTQVKALVIGIAGCLLLLHRKVGYKWLGNVQLQYVLTFFVIVLLVAVHFAGITVNGSRRWLKIGTTFQPSELAKICAVMLTAAYAGKYFLQRQRARYISFFSPPLVLALLEFVLVLLQPDLGTAVVIIGAVIIVYLMAGIRPRMLMSCTVITILVIIPVIYYESYRLDRVKAWIDPWHYAQGIGYQICQSMLTIGSGKIFGMQFGMGLSKFFYLPEAHTDFAFAIWAQESGFVGSVVLLLLFFAFARIGIKVAVKTENIFARLLAVGVTFLIAGQAVINIGMVSGVLPVVGVPLPFISYGGTSLIMNWVCVGILASIAGDIKNEES